MSFFIKSRSSSTEQTEKDPYQNIPQPNGWDNTLTPSVGDPVLNPFSTSGRGGEIEPRPPKSQGSTLPTGIKVIKKAAVLLCHLVLKFLWFFWFSRNYQSNSTQIVLSLPKLYFSANKLFAEIFLPCSTSNVINCATQKTLWGIN